MSRVPSVSACYSPSLLGSPAVSQQGPAPSSPNEHHVNSIILLCLCPTGFPSHPEENPKALLCPSLGHLLDLISYHSLFCSSRSNRVSLPAGPRTSQSFPVSRCFVLPSPPSSSFWGKRLWDVYIILISVESGLSSNLSLSETLSSTLYLIKLSL